MNWRKFICIFLLSDIALIVLGTIYMTKIRDGEAPGALIYVLITFISLTWAWRFSRIQEKGIPINCPECGKRHRNFKAKQCSGCGASLNEG